LPGFDTCLVRGLRHKERELLAHGPALLLGKKPQQGMRLYLESNIEMVSGTAHPYLQYPSVAVCIPYVGIGQQG
jgi:hypothetical protein